MNKVAIIGSLSALHLLLGGLSGHAIAQGVHEHGEPVVQTGEFQRIEQPLWVRGAVTAGGLGLIGLELWWFLFSKPKPRKTAAQNSPK